MMGRSIHGIESKFNKPISNETHDQTNPTERYNYLSKRKKEVEIELEEQFEVLKTNQSDLTTSLIDRQGFPRDDLPDLPSVRVARSRIHELKNDLRLIIEEISKTLPLILKPSSTSAGSPAPRESSSNLMKPFAQVDLVSDHSPAHVSGLKPGDQLIRFGSIDFSNHNNLKALVSFTKENEGNEIDVVWFRTHQDDENVRSMMSKTLVPSSGWGGRGLLGFHIVPI